MNRLQLLLAVLERRCGLSSRTGDVYVNVAGGLVVQDPAADLAVCLALAGSPEGSAPGRADLFLWGRWGWRGRCVPCPVCCLD